MYPILATEAEVTDSKNGYQHYHSGKPLRAELPVSPRASISKRAEAVGSLQGLAKQGNCERKPRNRPPTFPRGLLSAEWAPLDDVPRCRNGSSAAPGVTPLETGMLSLALSATSIASVAFERNRSVWHCSVTPALRYRNRV